MSHVITINNVKNATFFFAIAAFIFLLTHIMSADPPPPHPAFNYWQTPSLPPHPLFFMEQPLAICISTRFLCHHTCTSNNILHLHNLG